MTKSNRRRFLTQAPVAVAAVATAAGVSARAGDEQEKHEAHEERETEHSEHASHDEVVGEHEPKKKAHWPGRERPKETPLFSPVVTFGNMVFLSGIGAHFEGDVKAHTAHVLDQMKTNLEAVGSSMEKVLKVNVYLNDLKDYQAMNEVFRGRFGPTPGVRTTIAAAGGIPGDSLVEIDCIAYV
jgi:enamine deaminase RidA (YjgF/YER057c/UK114 family)